MKGREAAAEIRQDGEAWLVRASLRLLDPPLWWPHTHGEQPLLECSFRIDASDECHFLACGRIGFRHLFVPPDGASRSMSTAYPFIVAEPAGRSMTC